jgi:hypothetical protein
MKRSKNFQMATEAAMSLKPKFIKYHKEMLTVKLHYCKFYVFDCDIKDALIFQYINDFNVYSGNLKFWEEQIEEYRYNAYIEREEYDSDMFVLRTELDIQPFTTVDDIAYWMFQFSRELNHAIDLEYKCSMSVLCHI